MYHGQFEKGKRHGQGEMRSPGGTYYNGEYYFILTGIKLQYTSMYLYFNSSFKIVLRYVYHVVNLKIVPNDRYLTIIFILRYVLRRTAKSDSIFFIFR